MWLVLSWHHTLCSLQDRVPLIQVELEQLHWLPQPGVSTPEEPQRHQGMVALPLLSPERRGRAEQPPGLWAEPAQEHHGSPRKITHDLHTTAHTVSHGSSWC